MMYVNLVRLGRGMGEELSAGRGHACCFQGYFNLLSKALLKEGYYSRIELRVARAPGRGARARLKYQGCGAEDSGKSCSFLVLKSML